MLVKEKQKGFTLVEGLLVLLVLSVIGFGGYYVRNTNQDKNSANTSSYGQSATKDNDTYAGWQTYTDKENKFTLRYPSDWTFKAKKQIDTNAQGEPVYDSPDTLKPNDKSSQASIYIEAGKTSYTDAAKFWTNEGSGRAGEVIESKSLTINGHSSYYVKTHAQSDLYTYAIVSSGIGVNINAQPFDENSILDTHKKIAESIKFN